MQLGNGRWESTQFNSRLQPTQIALGTTQNGTDQLRLNYDYGTTANNGNVQSQTITTPTVGANPGFTAIQAYTYDSLNRLKSATETIGGSQSWKQTFLYDRYGNRNFDTANTTTLGSCPQAQCNPTVSATNNRFTSGQGYTYDLSGNVITDAEGRTFTFDAENKQTQVKDINNAVIGTYYYDGDGKRVKKAATTENIVFVYDAAGKLVEEYSGSTLQTSYLYAGSQLLATETATDTNYTATDQLGSPRVVTDQNGNVVSRRDFLPFGEEIFADGLIRTTTNKYSLTGQDAVRQRFTGYQRDLETGLDFAEARYYNNSQGRFTAVDPLLASGKSANPQTFNRYVYVMNNPLILSDSKGLQAGTKDDMVWCRSNCTISIDKKTNTASGNGGSLIDLRVDSVNADVPTEISSPPTTLGDHLLQLGSDTAVGAGGGLYNTFAGTVNTINSVANFIDGWPATGHASDAFGYLPYYNYRTPGEQSAALATTLVTLYAGSMSMGGTASSVGSISEQETGAITAFRVEGVPNQRLSIGENGNVSITGNRMLFLNFGDAGRAESFAATRVAQGMPGVEIKSFQVNRSFFNDLKNSAVPESMSSKFPTSPLRVDPSVPNQYGLRPCQFRHLCDNIVPGSGTSSPR